MTGAFLMKFQHKCHWQTEAEWDACVSKPYKQGRCENCAKGKSLLTDFNDSNSCL